MSRAKEKSGPLRVEDDEIYRFLRRNCPDAIVVKRAQEISSTATKMGFHTIAEFAQYVSTNRPKNQDHFNFLGYEYLSVARALILKDSSLFPLNGRGYIVHESEAFDVQPLKVSPDRNSSVVPGMFAAYILLVNSVNELIRKKVCIKTESLSPGSSNITLTQNERNKERDLIMEVKMYEECHGNAAGVVEMLSSGMSTTGPYLLLEHFGLNLNQFLSLRIPSIMERINLFTEICIAVCSLHALGIMHGSVNPDHILISHSLSHPSHSISSPQEKNRSNSMNFLQVKLCDLTCARKIGDSFPVTSSGSLRCCPGYIAPEVYFGRVGLCRATTKIDSFCLSLIGTNLLSRKPSVLKNLLPLDMKESTYHEEMKAFLRDQERINDIICRDLDSPLSDIMTSMCQLNPAERCDIETIVNMLQIRNSDIQSDMNSLLALGDLFDEITNRVHRYSSSLNPFLAYDSGGYQLFHTVMENVESIINNISSPHGKSSSASSSSSSVETQSPAEKLNEFHQSIRYLLRYFHKKLLPEDQMISEDEEEMMVKITHHVDEGSYTGETSAVREKFIKN
jgi:serine/threonine protein kinase